MNPNTSANRDVIELWGREFNLVKNGLSEAQVVSFVNGLVKQHDVLIQRQEHLVTLTKLAERTVSEADRLAEEIKKEAENKAKTEAARIISEAETSAKTQSTRIIKDAEAVAEAQSERLMSEAREKADQVIKEKETHALTAAVEQAEAIKATAEKLAHEALNNAETEARKLIAEAEARSRHIVEQKEAEATALAGEQSRLLLEKAQKEAATILEREKRRVQPELTQFIRRVRSQLLSELDEIKEKAGQLEAQFGSAVTDDEQKVPAAVENIPVAVKPDAFMDLVKQSDNSADEGEPTWEIEIVPPLDIMKIMSIVSYLDSLNEVSRTEIIPRNERTSVIIYTSNDLELLSLIKKLPEVTGAEETKNNNAGNERMRKISLALSARTDPVDSKILHNTAK